MKTVIEMAKEAGAELAELPMMDAIVFSVDDRSWNSACLEKFVEMVRADERAKENEACALIADEAAPYNAADLIRKRMKK